MNSCHLRMYTLLLLGIVFSLLLSTPGHAQFPLPKDVQVVTPVPNVPEQAAAFSGAWAGGAWDGVLPHILIVESISASGEASVIYSLAEMPDWNQKANFRRVQGRIENNRLTLMFTLKQGEAHVEYVIGGDGNLNGTYTRGRTVSKVTLKKTTLDEVGSLTPAPAIALNEKTLRIPFRYQGFFGSTKELQLEATLYRPNQTGRFPVVVFNHGSTSGGGSITTTIKFTVAARYFVEKGFAFLVPMRRGRGKSEGTYLEGGDGYWCGNEARGIYTAVEDLDAVFAFLREQSWADAGKVLIGGVSRGGILSVVYAGERPDTVKGVINFSGGWMYDRCSPDYNGQFFAEAAQKTAVPMIWLYGENDSYYSPASIRNYWAAFKKAGGKGQFYLFKDTGGNGHHLLYKPLFWRSAMDEYLKQLGLTKEKNP
mgnify:CR=1 FL=1